jgi:hypothetical protein
LVHVEVLVTRFMTGSLVQVCVPGGDKRRGEGFAKADNPKLWQDARIPAVVIEGADALKIKVNIM